MINDLKKLIKINKEDVLRYLEYKGQEIDYNLNDTIDKCIQITKDKINPRYILRVYPILRNNKDFNNEIKIDKTNLTLKSKDVYNLLKDSEKCVLIATTIGIEIEKEIRKYSYSELTKSIIIDACATTAIEELCDIIQDNTQMKLNKKGMYITNRYSPGYGDLSIQANEDIINILNTSKEIGLTITEKGIMIPRKSVIAIIGISQNKNTQSKKSCLNCLNNTNCKYKKGDDTCERKGIYKK